MYQSLYRKHRPRRFADVVGQEHITDVLAYQVEHGKVSHAYLFAGSRGIGKTTCAKILSRAVNCAAPVAGDPCGTCEPCVMVEEGRTTDVLEMDAASNTGVDYIRDIRSEAIFAPSALSNKVYIIDEAHMLTDSAFNALLKTLEEPPPGVIFILATTEMHKIPATILSRCQRFSFRRLPAGVAAGKLAKIAEGEGISITQDALMEIARQSEGGMRDAESLLELCAASGAEITAAMVREATGSASQQAILDIVSAVIHGDHPTIFLLLAELHDQSKDVSSLWNGLLLCYRNMLALLTLGKSDPKLRSGVLDITSEEEGRLSELCAVAGFATLMSHVHKLEAAMVSFHGKGALERRCIAELALVSLSPIGAEPVRPQGDAPAPLPQSVPPVVVAPTPPQQPVPVGTTAPGRPPEEHTPSPPWDEPSPTTQLPPVPTETPFTPAKENPPPPPQEEKTTANPTLPADFSKRLLAAYTAEDASGASFMDKAKYTRQGNRLTITLDDTFSKMMLANRGAEEVLTELASKILDETVIVEFGE